MSIIELILTSAIDKLAIKHSTPASVIRGRLLDGDKALKSQFDTLIEIGRRVAVCYMFKVDVSAAVAAR